MPKRVGLTAFILFFFMIAFTQEEWNYSGVDKKSYELFVQQKWTELIDYSKESRAHGIDFFYLQARTGIALYNLGKYRSSSNFFSKAWNHDRSFDWLQEYLYYSLVFGGRKGEALKTARLFSDPVKQKISYADKKPLRLALEAGYTFNPDFDKLKNSRLYDELQVGQNYGEAFFLKNYRFESLDFSHQVSPGIVFNHNFTHIGLNREEQVYWGSANTFPISINQFQYYFNPYVVMGEKVNLSPSLTFLWGNSDLFLGNFTPGTFYQTDYNFSDWILSTSSWIHFGNFSPGAEINLANIQDTKFTQFSGWFTFYPFSNLNFYLTPRIYFKNGPEKSISHNATGISGGIQAGPVHFYGQYIQGDLKNFIEPAGYVVANFPGRSENKYMASIYFPTGKKIQLVIRYINQDIYENYLVYSSGNLIDSREYTYVKHTLTTGISWNF